MKATALVVLSAITAVNTANGQKANEITVDATVVHGTLAYARATSPRFFLGIGVGLGVPQIDRTLSPEKNPDTGSPDFEEYFHVAPFVRYKMSERFEVDAGLRASVADLWECGASDCLPALFGGVYIQPMIGWRKIKFGSRLTAGVIGEGKPDTRVEQGDKTTNVVSLSPFLVRATFTF